MATLPTFLFDTYKRYKADANRVAAWLAETAQKYGLTLIMTPAPSLPSRRLKGKARKEARDAGICNANLSQIVTIKQFLDMAELIAAQKPRIKIPDLILRLFVTRLTYGDGVQIGFKRMEIRRTVSGTAQRHIHALSIFSRMFCGFSTQLHQRGLQQTLATSMMRRRN